MSSLTLTIPEKLNEECKKLNLNKSKICRDALKRAVGMDMTDTMIEENFNEAMSALEKVRPRYAEVLARREAEIKRQKEAEEARERARVEAEKERVRKAEEAEKKENLRQILLKQYREAVAQKDDLLAQSIKEKLRGTD